MLNFIRNITVCSRFTAGFFIANILCTSLLCLNFAQAADEAFNDVNNNVKGNAKNNVAVIVADKVADTTEQSATGFAVTDVEVKLVDKVYHLAASVEYKFSEDVLAAIENGVPIIIALDIELLRTRSYAWDVAIAELQQSFKLQFHSLSEQYIVENLNSGARATFPTLHSALYQLRDIKSLPVIDQNLLQKNKLYTTRIRARLQFDALPVPLRLNAYISRSWWLSSDWYMSSFINKAE